MKKVFLAILLILLVIPVKAATLTEKGNNLISRIENVKIELKNDTNSFDKWVKKYKTEFVNILDIETLEKISDYIASEKYEELFEFIDSKLEGDAKTEFEGLEFQITIFDYFELKSDLIEFITKNSKSLNIVSGTSEGISISFDMYESLKSMYDDVKPEINTLLIDLSDVFSDTAKDHFNNLKNLTEDELSEILDKYENFSDLIVEIILNFDNSLNEYETIFETISTSGELFDLTFKNKINNDLVSIIKRCKNILREPFNNFASKRYDMVTEYVAEVLNSTYEIKEKNQKLYDKMELFESINAKFNDKFDTIINQVDYEKIIEEIEKISNRVNNEFEKAINYIKEHLVVGDYDIVLSDNHDDGISINRATEMIILNGIYSLNNFRLQIALANGGTLNYENDYDNIATKSSVSVMDDETEMKKYVVVVKGDVNSNGSITITDAILAAYKSLGATNLDEYESVAADMNDNNSITITDAYMIAMNALNQGGE